MLDLSTNKMELIDAIFERWACLPVIGLIIGNISSVALFFNGMIRVSKSPEAPDLSLLSLVASFSGTTLTKPFSDIMLKPLT